MGGIISSIIAGAAMSIQGVFNTRLSEKCGLFEANAFVQFTAFIFALLAMFIFGKGNILNVTKTNFLYLTGGLFGIIITVFVMLGISSLKPTYAISVILISQLIFAAAIDAFGLFGTEKVVFNFKNYLGLGLMISGILVFKFAS